MLNPKDFDRKRVQKKEKNSREGEKSTPQISKAVFIGYCSHVLILSKTFLLGFCLHLFAMIYIRCHHGRVTSSATFHSNPPNPSFHQLRRMTVSPHNIRLPWRSIPSNLTDNEETEFGVSQGEWSESVIHARGDKYSPSLSTI